MSIILSNGNVAYSETPDSSPEMKHLDILITNGKITTFAPPGTLSDTHPDIPILDCTGLDVLPGGVDPHVHFSYEQGPHRFLSAHSWKTGSRAALLGGTTSVIDFVEQLDAPTLHDALLRRRQSAVSSAVDYGFHISIVNASPESLEAIKQGVADGCPSIKVYTAYDFRIDNESDLAAVAGAAAGAGSILMVHCEDNDAITKAVKELAEEGKTSPRYGNLARPAEGEILATKKVLAAADEGGCDVHIAHISTERGAEKVVESAKVRPGKVTGEVCTHHLVISDDYYQNWDHPEDLVMAPALRSKEDGRSLVCALAEKNGPIISTISDNCPFTRAQRAYLSRTPAVCTESGLKPLVAGVPVEPMNVEIEGEIPARMMPGGTASVFERYLVTYSEMLGVGAGAAAAAAAGAWNAAHRFGMANKGSISVGCDADFAIFDPSVFTTFGSGVFMDHSLYENISVQGKICHVLKAGEVVVRDGELDEAAISRAGAHFLHRTLN